MESYSLGLGFTLRERAENPARRLVLRGLSVNLLINML